MFATSSGCIAVGGFANENYNDYFNIPSLGGANDITLNPDFVNAGADNFQLQSNSPDIFAGTSYLAAATDFAGNPRPTNGAYAIGAYQ
jgi:hypothetical protein